MAIKITPPHSLCSDAANFSTNLALGDQGLGWVGILPDAIAHVDVSVNGEKLMFEGYGYHDKVCCAPCSPIPVHRIPLAVGR